MYPRAGRGGGARSIDRVSNPVREQLARLAADPDALAAWPGLGASGEAVREAAVLVLFGEREPARSVRAAPTPRDLDILLLARAHTLRSHAGQVAFPGGRRDDTDADLIETALREAQEETGLDPSGVDVLGAMRPLPLPRSFHVVTPVLGWWARPTPVWALDTAESALVFRTPVADLVSPDRRVTTLLRFEGQTWSGPAWLLDVDGTEQVLWGFTALVLDTMLERLGWAEPWDASRTLELPPPRLPD